MREMNLSQLEMDIIYGYLMGVLLNNVNVYGTGGGGGYIWGYSRPNSMNYYGNYEDGGSGGDGNVNSHYNFQNHVEITNHLTNPCFNQVFNDLQKANVEGKVYTILNDFGKMSSGCNFTIENQNIEPIDMGNGVKKYTFGTTDQENNIVLNELSMKQSSKEFIASIILHEMLHAYINSTDIVDHYQIANLFIKPIAELVQKIYTIKDDKEALAIALTGLKKSTNYDQVLKDLGLTEEFVTTTFNSHRNITLKKENGTYCQ